MSEPYKEVSAAGIAGVHLVHLTSHDDPRGSFTEIYRREWVPEGREMLQANVSRSAPGVLRGLHFHRRQADYWYFVSGVAFVGLFDLREGSPTHGRKAELRIDAEQDRVGLFLPPGVAHGFCAETEVRMLYLVDAYFEGADEFGLAWDDLRVGIAWPVAKPILSERDRANPPLDRAAADAPAYAG